VAYASVSLREATGTDFESTLQAHERVPELAVWDEGTWDECRWADEPSADRFEQVLMIVSSGSFPKVRSSLTAGQLHQFRDALVLEAHSAAHRSVFVTADSKGFVNHGKRVLLQNLLSTQIQTPEEFADALHASTPGA
jgi:hypothetical protein